MPRTVKLEIRDFVNRYSVCYKRLNGSWNELYSVPIKAEKTKINQSIYACKKWIRENFAQNENARIEVED